MSEFDPIEALEELAEELVLKGEGTPDEAGVTCQFCGTDITRPWELREQLHGAFEEHMAQMHPSISLDGPEDEDDDEEDDED